MTTLRERIETPLPIDETFAYVADFANSQDWDPGVATAERLDTGPVGVGSRYRLGVRMGGRVAPMEYRISVFEPPTRVVLTGEGSGVDRGRRHPVRAGRRRHAGRLHGRDQARWRSSGSSSRCSGGRSATWHGTPSAACSGRSTSAPRPPGPIGHEGRHRRGRRQRPDRRLCPARRSRGPPVRRRADGRRSRQDRRRRDRARADRGRHRLHRLQRADVPDVHPAAGRTRGRHATQ